MLFYKSKPTSTDTQQSPQIAENITCYNISTISIPKLILEHHTDHISSLQFANTHHSHFNILFSGSYDKSLVIWKISHSKFIGEKIHIIPFKSEITSIVIYPNDQYLLVGCFDHSIYIIKCDYTTISFNNVCTFTRHDNIVNSIAIDPFIEQNGRFASLSDKGRLIISSYNANTNQVNIVHDYEEFINASHKCSIIQKQIDWSVDGTWIVSVDYHIIKHQNVIHARLINLNQVGSSQILIGHDSPFLNAKFSKCLYSDKGNYNNDEFQLCATSDKNGNLIIWKVDKERFSVLVEVNNYSESNITSMVWSYNGEYLITVNSSGSVCTIALSEFNIKTVNTNNNSNNLYNTNSYLQTNQNINQVRQPKPTLIPSAVTCPPPSVFETRTYNDNLNAQQQQQKNQQTLDNLSQDIVIPNLHTRDKGKVSLCYENNINENNCMIKLKYTISPTLNKTRFLYQSKHTNKMIKLFVVNNYFYSFYDTNCVLHTYSLLNSLLISKTYIEDIHIITSYTKYLLILTSQHRIIITDVFTKQTILDDHLNVNSSPNSIFQTKINEIFFINLNQIIIKAESVNPYNNTNYKMKLYFDSRNNGLVLSNNSQLTQYETQLISTMKNLPDVSYYNSYFEKNIFFKDGEKKLNDNEYFKLSSDVDNMYEAIFKGKYFNNKTEYLSNYKSLLKRIIEHSKYDRFIYVLDDLYFLTTDTEIKNELENIYKELIAVQKQKEQPYIQHKQQTSVITQPLLQQSVPQALIPENHSNTLGMYDIIESQNMFDNGGNNNSIDNNGNAEVNDITDARIHELLNVNLLDNPIGNDKMIDVMGLMEHSDENRMKIEDENERDLNVPEVVIEEVVYSEKNDSNVIQKDVDDIIGNDSENN